MLRDRLPEALFDDVDRGLDLAQFDAARNSRRYESVGVVQGTVQSACATRVDDDVEQPTDALRCRLTAGCVVVREVCTRNTRLRGCEQVGTMGSEKGIDVYCHVSTVDAGGVRSMGSIVVDVEVLGPDAGGRTARILPTYVR